ncbi:LysR substrate-binding domain-containing protein [Stenotrophomonas sp. BIO128-Bstrain]|uniref:LysR substrate-binding domain-containing protein n=1 Tax=Stenotrophomonas sp. BIO128-Bstrain TaxID=3027225 RepID=UPI0024DEB3A2|nr:LysR substrate-binding domain-containing protein [Stenotrophomonas sp. BIO128-Bstrain]WIA61503.1 LysR substrate-binding domain-containing protein [Stenotrophomonas sp. BIO128-Bstrain]
MGAVLPLLALRAFVETGRHGSLKAAAAVMGVTPGAISQQLKLLQARTGVELFTRTRHGVALTAAGAQVHPALLRAFDQIQDGMATLDAIHARQTLTISTVPSFAAAWLVPRLGRFTARHPEIEVRVEASSALADLRRDRIDIAIRHGLGEYPGLVSRPLAAPVLLPVACPTLLAEGPPIHSPVDCLQYPLLQDSDRSDWSLWFRALGLPADPRIERGPAFDDDVLLIRAAEAGQGIALVRDLYVDAEVASGRLAVVLDQPWPTRFAYYAVTLPGAEETPSIAAFLGWLQDEVEAPTSAL